MTSRSEELRVKDHEGSDSRELRGHNFVPTAESMHEIAKLSEQLHTQGVVDKDKHVDPEEWHVTIASFYVPQARKGHKHSQNGARWKILNNVRFFNIALYNELNSHYPQITFSPTGYAAFSYRNRNLLGIELATLNGERLRIKDRINHHTLKLSRFVLRHTLGIKEKDVDLVQTPRFERPHLVLAELDTAVHPLQLQAASDRVELPEKLRFELAPPSF